MAKLKTLAERTRDNDWPAPATFKSPEECVAAYDNNYIGCIPDPDGAEEIEAQKYGSISTQKYSNTGGGIIIASE